MRQHPEVTRLDRADGIFWKYRGKLYPDRLTKKNAMANIESIALKYCKGGGIDIGAGRFPFNNCKAIQNDKRENAYNLSSIADRELDYIFSSHCLEHLERPWDAIDLWTSKLKLGGVLFLYLPHPDMELWRPGAPWVGDQHKWIPRFDTISHELRSRGYEIISGDGKKDNLWSFHIAAKKKNAIPAGYEVNEDYINEYFKDKKVLVLGSAPSVRDMAAEFMEKFDIICRVNNYENFNACKRTDVYASFFGTSIRKKAEDLRMDGVKLLMCKCPKTNVIVKNDDGTINHKLSDHFDGIYARRGNWFKETGIPYYIQTVKNFNANNKPLGQICTTGVAAILDILRCNPSLLYFAGYDFAMSGIHNKNKRMIKKPDPNCHHWKQEFEMMRDLVNKHEVLDCSPLIKELFKKSYQGFASWTL